MGAESTFFIRQFRLTKWSFLVHSTTRNAPYIHPSHDSILELWQTFPNAIEIRMATAISSTRKKELIFSLARAICEPFSLFHITVC